MQIKTLTNILSSAHKSLVDFEFCLSENFMKQRRYIRGTERARFATQLAVIPRACIYPSGVSLHLDSFTPSQLYCWQLYLLWMFFKRRLAEATKCDDNNNNPEPLRESLGTSVFFNPKHICSCSRVQSGENNNCSSGYFNLKKFFFPLNTISRQQRVNCGHSSPSSPSSVISELSQAL